MAGFRQRRLVVGMLLASVLAGVASAATGNNTILYPDSNNLTFHYMDTVDVAYTTTYETPYIYLWCLDAADDIQQIIYYSPSDVAHKSVLPVKLTSNTQYTGGICWFNLVPALVESSDDSTGVSSPRFNYIKTAAQSGTFGLDATALLPTASSATEAPSTTASPTTAAASTTTSCTDVPATNAAATSSAAAPSSSSGEGLSAGAKAGIGLSVVVAVCGSLSALAWFLLRRHRNGPSTSGTAEVRERSPSLLNYAAAPLTHELPEDRQAGELDGGKLLPSLGGRHELQ